VYWEATLPNLINDDETLVNFITTKRPAKGEREDKGEDPSPSQKCTIPKAGEEALPLFGAEHFEVFKTAHTIFLKTFFTVIPRGTRRISTRLQKP
jgi:hypothetical protein